MIIRPMEPEDADSVAQIEKTASHSPGADRDFGCHEASREYHACGTGGWRDTGVSVHVCVI